MKIPTNIFVYIDKMILKCICNKKEVRANITIQKKYEVGEFKLLNVKIIHVLITKTVWD